MRFLSKPIFSSSLLAVLLFLSQPAYSNLIQVTTTEDELNSDGDCSLREAVEAANQDLPIDACSEGAGEDQIQLPVGIFELTQEGIDEDNNQTGDLDIRTSLILTGEGADRTLIDASELGDRIMDLILVDADVEVSGVTLTGGDPLAAVTNDGGAISLIGGGLELNGVQITENQAENGGALAAFQSSITIRNSTLSNNTAGERGGAINVDISTVILINSTISGNSAANGGGLAGDNAEYLLRSSTVFSNNASSVGGGIFGASNVIGSFGNTILAGNTAGSEIDCGEGTVGTVSIGSAGFNIFGDVDACTEPSTDDQIVLNSNDLNLDNLADNDGPTLTHALQPGSPAIDQGNPAGCNDTEGNPLTTDQIGQSRVIDGNQDGTSRCDVGAFEFQIEDAGGGGCSLILH